jgi:hypothetical protein
MVNQGVLRKGRLKIEADENRISSHRSMVQRVPGGSKYDIERQPY